MENTQEILKVSTGVTGTIGYECSFADGNKKTVNIGSYKLADIPSGLATNIKAFNQNPDSDFVANFVSAEGGSFTGITACTITAKNINVLIG